ncbi:hypothetical protein GCM10023311_21980 [Flaviramulus aquimarinus]|uniref:Ig-like domain-containing protein n=1 Tax=Flaviramulus aquimarinus TaxID=1170456 RepID=A0ABP9F8P1_9FLAO
MKQLLLLFLLSVNLIYSQNWTTSSTSQLSLLNNVSVVNDDIIWIMDQTTSNGFSISTDGGVTWTKKSFPALFADNNFSTGVLSAVDENTAYIIVSYSDNSSLNGLYKTTDSGNNWIRESLIFNGGSSFPNQVHFWDANHGFAMGDGLELYVYLDGFWYDQSSTLSSVGTWSLNSSFYLRIIGSSAYFITGAGTIIKTPDMGISWSEITTPFNSQANLSFAFKNDSNGILVYNDNSTSNIIYSTSNGGQTWNFIGSDIANLYNTIYFLPSLNKYVSTSTNSNGTLGLSYSSNNGLTWTADTQLSNEFIGEIESSSDGKIFTGGWPNVYYQIPDPSTHPDYNALIAVYNALDGPNWIQPWDITKPIYSWDNSFSLGFDEVTDRVTTLSLNFRDLKGEIPSEIGSLKELEILELLNNDISGEVPSEIWTLTKLKNIFLGGQSSKQLKLSGGVPSDISNLQDLEWLNLTGIPLNQPLQQEIFNLPNLVRLRIAECGLTGTIPKELAGISDVLAGGNEFEGAIPQEFLDAAGNFRLNIVNNYFNFANLEPLVQANNYQNLNYSPQRTKDVEQNIESAPGLDITLNIDDTSLNKTTSAKGDGDVYQWYKDNVAISGAESISYTVTNAQESDSGIYYCIITNPLLPDLIIQSANITIVIDATLSIEEPISKSILIFPNPTKNILNIKLNTSNKAIANLYDMSGRLVLKQKLQTEQSVIDIKDLNAGIYVLKIEAKNKVATKRIIKQ